MLGFECSRCSPIYDGYYLSLSKYSDCIGNPDNKKNNPGGPGAAFLKW